MAKKRSCRKFEVDYDELREMFSAGATDKEAAEIYGVSPRTIRNHRSIAGIETTRGNCREQHNDAVERLNVYLAEHAPTLEYMSGNVSKKATATFRCKDCGYVFDRRIGNLKQGCVKCPQCKKAEAEKARQLSKKKEPECVTATCIKCGEQFSYERSFKYRKFCSTKCRRDYHHKIENRKRRNADTGGSYRPTWERLYKAGDCNCYLCGGKVDINDYVITDNGVFIAGESYPSVDHVIALANGGLDSYENARIAHMKCNSLKRDIPLEVFKCSDYLRQ